MSNTKAPLDEKNYEKADASGELGMTSTSFGLNSYLLVAGLICSLSPFVYGYNISVVGGMNDYFSKCASSANQSQVLPNCINCDGTWKLVVAAFCVGGLIGALSAPFLGNYFGRKKVLLYHNLFYIFGTVLLTLAPHVSLLILGRLFIGMGSGICTIVAPTYLSEISTKRVRGILGNMFQAAIVIGIFFSQAVGLGFDLDPTKPTYNWRILFAISGVLPFIQMALVPFLVESPKWLADKGRREECTHALQKLRKGATSGDVQKEVVEMIEKSSPTDGQGEQSLTVMGLLKSRAAKISLLVGILSHATQQLSGINAVFYYGDNVFKGLGLGTQGSKLAFLGITVWNIFMTAVSVYLIDHSGRRPLILSSAATMIFADAFIIISSFLDWKIPGAAFVFIFVGGFAVGLGPVPWVITGDIFPPFALSAGSLICVGVNWTANTIVALTFDPLEAGLGNLVFLPYAILTAAFLVFAVMMFPETRGKAPSFI